MLHSSYRISSQLIFLKTILSVQAYIVAYWNVFDINKISQFTG